MGRLTSPCCPTTIVSEPEPGGLPTPPNNYTSLNAITSSFLFADKNLQLILQVIWIASLLVFILFLVFDMIIKFSISRESNSHPPNYEASMSCNCFRGRQSNSNSSEQPVEVEDIEDSTRKSYGSINKSSEFSVAPIKESSLTPRHDFQEPTKPPPSPHSKKDEIDKLLERLQEQEKERKRRLEQAEKKQEELKEKQQRRREELENQRELMKFEMINALLRSLTHPMMDEAQKFNEWAEQPD